MKKKISVLAAVLLAIGLTACGNNESQVSADTTQNIQMQILTGTIRIAAQPRNRMIHP